MKIVLTVLEAQRNVKFKILSAMISLQSVHTKWSAQATTAVFSLISTTL